ncbi:MAG: ATP-binding protein [Acidobacteriota bacterium]
MPEKNMNRETRKECSRCGGTGWVLEEKEGLRVARRCRCFTDKRKEVLLKQASIPRRYEYCSLDNFEEHHPSHRRALKIARKFVKDFPVLNSGILLLGSPGVGKTHLSVGIIKELIKEKKTSCYFCDFRELIHNIQASYSPDSPLSESEVLNPVFRADVLVLDELGAKRTTAWVEEMVFYIINHRYINKKLTIFTSNYPDKEEDVEDRRQDIFKKDDVTLVDRVGERLRSRIYEMCKIVEVLGDDYRKKIKQAGYRW